MNDNINDFIDVRDEDAGTVKSLINQVDYEDKHCHAFFEISITMTSQGPRIGFCCVNNDPTVIYTTVVKYSDKTCLDFDTQVTLSGEMMKGPDQELVAGIGLQLCKMWKNVWR